MYHRLDAIMEENRLAAIKRAEQEEERRYQLRLQNLAALKEQIKAHETAKVGQISYVGFIILYRNNARKF